jgi:histidyl-tRNA synthetase
MNDILPAEAALWEWFEARVRDWLRSYGYRNIRTPIVEPTPLFVRGHRRGHRHRREGDVLLRGQLNGEPDAAPGGHRRRGARGDRAQPALRRRRALWYMGPDVPPRAAAAGRYRQFHQVGVEALGFAGPDVDAEQILMLRGCGAISASRRTCGWRSTASAARRAPRAPRGADRLLRAHEARSTPTRRAACTPTRCASSTPRTRRCRRCRSAPQLIDYLGEASLRALRRPAGAAARAGIASRSTRAWCAASTTTTSPCSSGSPTARRAGHGVRRRPLRPADRALGGKPTPGIGFGMGIERVIELIREAGSARSPATTMRTCCTRAARRSTAPSCSPSAARRRARRDPARRRGEPEVADEEGRRQRAELAAPARPPSRPAWRCRRGALCGAAYRAARRNCRGAEMPGRIDKRQRLGRRWHTTSKSRNSWPSSRHGGRSTATCC